MMLSLFISHRVWQGKETSGGVMTRIAVVAVAISVAVMILALTVTFGFKREMNALVSRFAADVTVADWRSFRASESVPITDNEQLRGIICSVNGIEDVNVYAMRGGIIRSETAMVGMMLKGVESGDGIASFGNNLLGGRLPTFDKDRHKEILVSHTCAEALGIDVDSRVELLFVNADGAMQREIFKVCGVYDVGLDDEQATLIFTDIRNVRKINGWSDMMITGYEVYTSGPYNVDAVADAINANLFELYEGDENLSAISARTLYSHIFNWLGTHDVNAMVIITIMFIVALFNMITAMLIIVFERVRMIGILKTLGMDNTRIRRIFHCRAADIVIKGMVAGNAIGIGLSFLQRYTSFVKLDADGYNVSVVPIDLSVVRIIYVDIIFIIAILSILTLVTTIIARIHPADTIRYE